MKVLIVLTSIVGLSLAQFPNGRILEPPVPALCAQRVIHERSPDGKGYWFSWKDQNTKGKRMQLWYKKFDWVYWDFNDHIGKEEDWLGARNFCRQRCMDAVSVETSPENEWIKQRIVDGKVSSNSSMTSVRPIEFDKNLNRLINYFLRLSFLCQSSSLFMNLCHAFKHLIINWT